MDPSSIPPPAGPATNTLPMPTIPATVPFLQEPNNHSPPPPATTGTNAAPSHPPYAEMIYTAIEALKEKEGSSKRAIAKYIEQVYKEQLPPTHSTLLTHHLNRLKNNGMLQMVKKSYKLPRSADATDPNPSPSGSSRPRGRPRKAQIQPQPQSQLPQLEAQPQPQLAGNVNVNVPQQQQNAEPVWAALGLADEPAVQPGSELKKRPGRPKKNEVAPGAAETPNPSLAVATPGRRGRPPGSKNSKRKPGRPPKASPAGGPAAAAVADAAASGGPKRRPGRPAKNQQVATPVTFAAVSDPDAAVTALPPAPVVVPAGGVPVGSPRARGRPKRILGDAVTGAIIPVAVGATGRERGRGRGRGRGHGFGTFGRGRGRGRGRPVGRPRKGGGN
ncbi:HMG-Y-related protein A [Arachis hypogaea]|nr:HMG-Y-related protein A [Arachis hypogaea]